MSKHPGKGFGAVWLSGLFLLTACQPVTSSGGPLAVSLPTASPTALEHGFGGEPQALPRVPQRGAERPKPVSPLPRGIPSVFPSAFPSVLSVPIATPAQPSDSHSGGGGSNFVAPAPVPTPLFYIADILESETGKSILNAREQAWQPDYFSAQPLRLTIVGNFALSSPLQESQMRFTYEPGLLHQTLTGPEPRQRILLDGVRPLEVLQIAPEHIQLELPTQYLTDLQVSGTHTLSVESGEQRLSVNIQVKGAETSLAPQIERVTVQSGEQLKIEGHYFMLNPAWVNVDIDGQLIPVGQTEIDHLGVCITWLNLSHFPLATAPGLHLLRYRTPLGITLFSYEVHP